MGVTVETLAVQVEESGADSAARKIEGVGIKTAAVAKALDGTKIDVIAEFETRGYYKDIADFKAVNLARRMQLPVDANLQTGSFDAEWAAFKQKNFELPVELRMSAGEMLRMRAEIKAKAEANPVEIPIKAKDETGPAQNGLKGLSQEITKGILGAKGLSAAFSLLKFPAYGAAANAAASGISAIAAAAVSAVAALAPLGGLLGALPGLAGGILQGFGVAKLAIGGVGGALKAYTQQQNAAGGAAVKGAKQTASAAKSMENAAHAVKVAQQGLADAQQAAADGVTGANEKVVTAEKHLAEMQRNAKDAQENLTAARARAIETLHNLTEAVQRNSLAERRARLNLAAAQAASAKANIQYTGADAAMTAQQVEAQRLLAQSQQGLQATDTQREDAAINLSEAELNLHDAIEKRQKSQEDLATAQRVGIEGDLGVIAAHKAVVTANDNVVQANLDLQKSVAEVAKAQVAGARSVEAAQYALAQALEAVGAASEKMAAAGAGGIDRFAAAMAKMSPAARALVTELLSFKEPIKMLRESVQAAMFPGLIVGLEAIKPLFAALTPVLTMTGKILGDFAATLGQFVGSPAFSSLLVAFGNANNEILKTLLQAIIPLVDAAAKLAVAFAPLAQWVATLAVGFAKWIDGVVSAKVAGEGFGGVIELIKNTCRLLWDILQPLMGILKDVFAAALPAGQMLLGILGDNTKKLKDFTGSLDGQKGMKKFFDDHIPLIREIGGLIGDVFKAFLRIDMKNLPGTIELVKSLKDKLLPVIEKILNALSGDFGKKLIDTLAKFGNLIAELPVGKIGTMMEFFGRIFDVLSKIAASPVGGFILTLLAGFITFGAIIKTVMFVLGPFLEILGVLSKGLGILIVVFQYVAVAIGVGVGWLVLIVAAFILLAVVIVKNWDTIKKAFGAAWDFIKNVIGWVIDFIGGLPGKILEKLSDFVGAGGRLISGLWDGIKNVASSVFNWFREMLPTILKFLFPAGPAIMFLKEHGMDMLRGLWNGITAAAGAVWDFFKGLKDKIFGFIGRGLDFLHDFGKDIVTGLGKGLQAGVSFLKDAWNRIMDMIPLGLADRFKMHSASRLMRDMAFNIPKGVALGILDGRSEVTNAMNALNADIAAQASVSMGMSAPGLSTRPVNLGGVNLVVNVNGNPNDPNAVGAAVESAGGDFLGDLLRAIRSA